VVNNCLKNTAEYGAKKSTGRLSKLSERDKRRIYRSASNSTSISVKITSDLGLNANSRAIYKNPTLVHRKMRRAPTLTNVHKRLRLEFARQNMNRYWSKVLSLGEVFGGHIHELYLLFR
jgi:hypothetical protein